MHSENTWYDDYNNRLTSVLFRRIMLSNMRYTIAQFNKDFPTDDACLDVVFQNRYGDLKFCPACAVVGAKFYRVKGRKCYACEWCGYQLHPLAQTIFHKSETPLKSWFYAIYLFSVSKNGVAAKELERHLGVTYKTALRMAHKIRSLMVQGPQQLDMLFGGDVEADETYIGGKRTSKTRYTNKTAIYGMVERNGRAMAFAKKQPNRRDTEKLIGSYVVKGSRLLTDESKLYWRVSKQYNHMTVRHQDKEYVRGDVHTNTIEGFWGQIKRSLDGTYHCVSPKYLQNYVNEFVFRYNFRGVAVYPALLELASRRVG